MQFHQYTPPAHHPLFPYVSSIWRIENHLPHTVETILPKQVVDILFNLGAPHHVARGATSFTLKDFHIDGPQTCAIQARPQGVVKILGISLKMDGCSALFGLPMSELADHTVEGSALFRRHPHLWEQVAEAQDFTQQCDLLLRWLLCVVQPATHLDLVQYACHALRERPSAQTLDALAAQLHISSRHLRRIMLRQVGIGPAQYIRLSRFAKSLLLMPQPASLTDIAYDVCYADQAHFCRDFKEIAGMTPNEYRRQMSQVPGHVFVK